MAQFTNFLGDKNEISKENLFIDGTKIESSANRYSFVWKKTTNKNLNKMLNDISSFVLKCENDFGIKVIYKNKLKKCHLKKLLKKLKRL